MLWRARNELECIKTLLEKEFQIVSWDLFGFCSHPWLPNTDLEIKLWKVEGGPAQMSALGWFREPPMSLNLNLDSWQRMTKSQQLEMRRLDCQRQQTLASSWSTLSMPAHGDICAQTDLQPLWAWATAIVRGVSQLLTASHTHLLI